MHIFISDKYIYMHIRISENRQYREERDYNFMGENQSSSYPLFTIATLSHTHREAEGREKRKAPTSFPIRPSPTTREELLSSRQG